MLEQLKQQVYKANMMLLKYGLVIFTWGNVSGIDRERGLIGIKPSGVKYDKLRPEDIVIFDLAGKVVDGNLNPSSDTPTHLELYKKFEKIGGVVHTHSSYATAFAQACVSLPAYGTTHADNFYGEIPCTRSLTKQEALESYEKSTGLVILEAFAGRDENAVPAALAANHGPFCWGRSPSDAVHNAVMLEEIAHLALNTRMINPAVGPISGHILDKHYLRK